MHALCPLQICAFILDSSPGNKSALEASMAATLAAISIPTPPSNVGM